MTTAPKLEPCPMCGSPWTIEGGGGAGYFGACSLKECGLTTALFATKIYAIAASNRRAAPSAGLREALELLQGFLSCPEIADCAPEDKDPETDDLERRARALTLSKEGGEVASPHQTIARDE